METAATGNITVQAGTGQGNVAQASKALNVRALKLYGIKFGVPFFKPDYVSYSFIPFFKRMGYVWVHIPSVIRFCHISNPTEFGYLTRYDFRIIGTHKVINSGRETRGFRLIPIADFERETGIKV